MLYSQENYEKVAMQKSRSTKIALLGTGNPNPDPDHQGPSLAIIVGHTPYLVDFGPGVVRQAAALTPLYGGELAALDPVNLRRAFLTHLHSDHTIGLPDLMLTPWIMGRRHPLELYGPTGTSNLTNHLMLAYDDDIQYRLQGSEPTGDCGWQINTHEYSEGEIYKDHNLKVEAFAVKHGSWSNAYGFRFTTPDKVIVISGDTAPCDNIIKFGAGADILIHEVYYHKAFVAQKSPEWQNYHAAHHTSTIELAKIAAVINPGLLVTYHTLFWGATAADLLDEIKTIYSGDVLIGKDLQIL